MSMSFPRRSSAPGHLLVATPARAAHPSAGARRRWVGWVAAATVAITLSACSGGGSGGMNMSGESPTDGASASPSDDMAGMDHDSASADANGDGHDHVHVEPAGDGTEASLEGLTLDGISPKVSTDNPGRITFRIMKENGAPLNSFEINHERPMHVFLFSKDLSFYRHDHPVMNSGGTWTLQVPPLPAGEVHLVTDFIGTDDEGEMHALTLGSTITVDGSATAVPLPAPEQKVTVDGFVVKLADGLTAGTEAKLNLTITKGGKPAALEPYLGAWSHTVAISAATGAVTHLHPAQDWEEGAAAPETLTFVWTPAASGETRVFVEFGAEGTVHRAEFTRQIG